MSWVKLDTAFPTHPKVLAAGPIASLLYVCGLCYCQTHLTDGHISRAALPTLYEISQPTHYAKKLVSCGLWEESTDGDGWMVHDYTLHQRSKEEVERIKEENRNRVAKHRSNALRNAEVTKPDTESRYRKQIQKETTLSDPYESDFAECWTHYPRKEGRKPAYLAYVARRRANESPGDLLTATKNYARECRGKETEYIKLGSTFFGAKDWWRDKLSTNGNGSAPPETCEHCHAWVSANCTSPGCTYPPALEKRS